MVKSTAACFGKKAKKSQIIINNCQYLSRVLGAIKYTQSLHQNMENEATKAVAMEMYINEEYRTCLDDYNHIITTHSDHLEDIYQQLHKCKLSNCFMAKRCNNNDRRRDHQKSHNNNIDADENFKANFYFDLLDRIHFWLHHQFDVGMRVQMDIMRYKDDGDYFTDNTQVAEADREFEKMKQEIILKRDEYKMEQSKGYQHDKYTLHVQKREYRAENGDDGQTFIDSILQQLQQEKIAVKTIESFTSFMEQEEYDSDAIIADINHITQDLHDSNIMQCFKNQSFCEFMQALSYDMNRMLYFLLLSLPQVPICL